MPVQTSVPFTTIIFGFLLSTICGAIYHLIRGGTSRRLLLDLLAGWVGFWAGDAFATYTGWSFAQVGLLNVGMGLIGSLGLLIIVDILLHVIEPAPKTE